MRVSIRRYTSTTRGTILLGLRRILQQFYFIHDRTKNNSLLCLSLFFKAGWLVVSRISVALAIFQPYRDLKTGDCGPKLNCLTSI